MKRKRRVEEPPSYLLCFERASDAARALFAGDELRSINGIPFEIYPASSYSQPGCPAAYSFLHLNDYCLRGLFQFLSDLELFMISHLHDRLGEVARSVLNDRKLDEFTSGIIDEGVLEVLELGAGHRAKRNMRNALRCAGDHITEVKFDMDFSVDTATTTDLMEICADYYAQRSNLLSLSLEAIWFLESRVDKFLPMFTNLQSLTLTGIICDDAQLDQIVLSAKSLRILKMRHLTRSNGTFLQSIQSELRVLKLVHCNFNKQYLYKCFERNGELEELKICWSCDVTDEDLFYIAEKLKNLRKLKFSPNFRTRRSHNSREIVRNLSHLKSLPKLRILKLKFDDYYPEINITPFLDNLAKTKMIEELHLSCLELDELMIDDLTSLRTLRILELRALHYGETVVRGDLDVLWMILDNLESLHLSFRNLSRRGRLAVKDFLITLAERHLVINTISLVNSDRIVTEKWFDRLVSARKADPTKTHLKVVLDHITPGLLAQCHTISELSNNVVSLVKLSE